MTSASLEKVQLGWGDVNHIMEHFFGVEVIPGSHMTNQAVRTASLAHIG